MDYEDLSLAIGEAGAGGHRRAGRAARAAVPGWVIGALRPVADGSSPLRAVTHPLGFTCLPVERAGRFGVCVHLWSPRLERVTPTTSAIHAHCWHLTSYALFGRLENQLMIASDSSSVPGSGSGSGNGDRDADRLYRMLEVRSRGDVDELLPTERFVRCVPGQRQVISTGDVYTVPAGEFHTTRVLPAAEVTEATGAAEAAGAAATPEAATVALGRMTPGVADTSLGSPAAAGHEVRRRRCDAEQTATAARIVLDRLLAATACPA